MKLDFDLSKYPNTILAKLLRRGFDANGPRVAPLDEHDQSLLVRTALRHDVAALLLNACQQADIVLTPDQVDILHQRALLTAGSNLNTMYILHTLANSLKKARVPFLLLKGGALNVMQYEQPDLRMMTDADVLIHAEDVDRVDQLLTGLGYQMGRRPVRSDYFPRYYYEREYYSNDPNPLRLDIHVRPFRPLRYQQTLPADALWDAAQMIPWKGLEAALPSNENMLIHLVTHSAIHGNGRLLWLYDIALFCHQRSCALNWDDICDKAQEWRLTLPMRLGLQRVGEVFSLPEHITQTQRFCGPVHWRDRWVLSQSPQDAWAPIRHILMNVLTTRGLRFRCGYLRSVLLPDRTHMKEIYPYRHPGWLLCAHAWRFARRLIRKFLPSPKVSASR